jgi:hypothetical protein
MADTLQDAINQYASVTCCSRGGKTSITAENSQTVWLFDIEGNEAVLRLKSPRNTRADATTGSDRPPYVQGVSNSAFRPVGNMRDR